jgi:hypothetical protein
VVGLTDCFYFEDIANGPDRACIPVQTGYTHTTDYQGIESTIRF